MSGRRLIVLVGLIAIAGCGGKTPAKPIDAELRTGDGFRVAVSLTRKGSGECVRTTFAHAMPQGSSSLSSFACDQPGASTAGDGDDGRYTQVVYRWRGDGQALLVDFPERCAPLRIAGARVPARFRCSATMPGVRITAIPEGQTVEAVDGSRRTRFDLRRPCTRKGTACTIYR